MGISATRIATVVGVRRGRWRADRRGRSGAIAGAGLALALTGLAAACGSGAADEAAQPPSTVPQTQPSRTAPSAVSSPTAPRRPPAVLVTIVDGDTHRRVAGAHVVIGRRGDYADRRGVAAIALRRRGAFDVRVSAPTYETRTVRIQFRNRPRAAVRLYRPGLQWTLYGANARRTQLRPASTSGRRSASSGHAVSAG